MNENIDLTKILKDCPKGTKFYSLAHGEVEFQQVEFGFTYPIVIKTKNDVIERFTSDGKLYCYDGECILFPLKDQRDWSKFTAPWYKKERFDPKTLQPFDKILVERYDNVWVATLFSHYKEFRLEIFGTYYFEFTTVSSGGYRHCIPYNDDTKHLVGTTTLAPEYYRYWED